MNSFDTKALPADFQSLAPDGSEVRILLGLSRGQMAHFQLRGGQTSSAVVHRTVEEIWYFLGGEGEMWRAQDGRESIVDVAPGICLSIPLGTRFQFRASGSEPLQAVAVTMPPWPGNDEAMVVDGPWIPSA